MISERLLVLWLRIILPKLLALLHLCEYALDRIQPCASKVSRPIPSTRVASAPLSSCSSGGPNEIRTKWWHGELNRFRRFAGWRRTRVATRQPSMPETELVQTHVNVEEHAGNDDRPLLQQLLEERLARPVSAPPDDTRWKEERNARVRCSAAREASRARARCRTCSSAGRPRAAPSWTAARAHGRASP